MLRGLLKREIEVEPCELRKLSASVFDSLASEREAGAKLLVAAKAVLARLESNYADGFDAIVDAEYVALRAAIATVEGR